MKIKKNSIFFSGLKVMILNLIYINLLTVLEFAVALISENQIKTLIKIKALILAYVFTLLVSLYLHDNT